VDAEFSDFSYHRELNPKIWDEKDVLKPAVRDKLLKIAKEFEEYLGIHVDVVNIVIAGSLANYNYTKFSDIDLHIFVNDKPFKNFKEALSELFISKKSLWNATHDIKIFDFPVEVYVKADGEKDISSGVYSVTDDSWVVKPNYDEPDIDETSVVNKAVDLMDMIDKAIETDASALENVKAKIKRLRQSGLEQGGEFSVENLSFKVIRRNGYLEKLYDTSVEKRDKELSLESQEIYEGYARTRDQVRSAIIKLNKKGWVISPDGERWKAKHLVKRMTLISSNLVNLINSIEH